MRAIGHRADAKKALKRKVHSPPMAQPPAAAPQKALAEEEDLMILSDGEASREGLGGAAAPMGGPMNESQVLDCTSRMRVVIEMAHSGILGFVCLVSGSYLRSLVLAHLLSPHGHMSAVLSLFAVAFTR